MKSANTHAAQPDLPRRTVLGIAALAGLSLAGCSAERPPVQGLPTTAAPSTPNPVSIPVAADPSASSAATELPAPRNTTRLLASLTHSDEIARIDPGNEDPAAVEFLSVGAAPWGVGVHAASQSAYVATAEGLAVVDLATFKRTRLVPFLHPAPNISQGEYRPGGLGLAVAPDGSAVYVAVGLSTETTYLEVFDTARGEFTGSVKVGWRPFDVVVAAEGSWVATIDHDSFTVTVVNPKTLDATTHKIAPFGTEGGLASWEKIHYGAADTDGTLLLPVQGKVVVRLNPVTGATSTIPSHANSHTHGTALAGRELLTVGTGSFGNADGVPNLSILNVDTGDERLAPLDVPHETVTSWTDDSGTVWAAVAGGNTRNEGWDGITLVRLDDLHQSRLAVSGYPQAVVAYSIA